MSARFPYHAFRRSKWTAFCLSFAVFAAVARELTNTLVLPNGIVRVTRVDAGPPRQFFIISEPT